MDSRLDPQSYEGDGWGMAKLKTTCEDFMNNIENRTMA